MSNTYDTSENAWRVSKVGGLILTAHYSQCVVVGLIYKHVLGKPGDIGAIAHMPERSNPKEMLDAMFGTFTEAGGNVKESKIIVSGGIDSFVAGYKLNGRKALDKVKEYFEALKISHYLKDTRLDCARDMIMNPDMPSITVKREGHKTLYLR